MWLFTAIVAYAEKSNGRLLPCEVWELYEKHPEDFHYIWAFQGWRAAEEEKEYKNMKRGGQQPNM
jgi:hypothetical protein